MMLLPQPKKVKENKGTFLLDYKTCICLDADLAGNAFYYAGLLKEEIRKILGFDVTVTKGTVNLSGKCIFLKAEDGDEEESYSIDVEKDSISLFGGSEAGLLYAISSLRLLIREYGACIPCCRIEDAPDIKKRGFSYDVTRGRIPTLEFLKEIADKCALYKINELQLYLEHSYMFRNESEVWRDDTPLTAEEIMEFDAYCARLHVDLIPTLASFGHLYELLRSRSFKEYCELEVDVDEKPSYVERMRHHTVDVSNEKSYDFVTKRIKEYMDLFSSKYFNICADETFDLGKGKSRKLAEEKGEKAVYIEFLKKICDFVISCGKIPMYWGDIIVEKPEIIKELPEESICLNWEYDPVVKEENLKKLSGAGAKNIYVCPAVQGFTHMINNHADAYKNIYGMCKNGHKYNVLGVMNTDWGDLGYVEHPEFTTVGMIYGAAFSWSSKCIKEDEINKRISALQYLDATEKVVDIFKNLGNAECFNWWAFVTYKEAKERGLEADIANVISPENFDKTLANIKLQEETSLELYGMLKDLSKDIKEVANAYLLMAEGQSLCGKAVLLLCNSEKKLKKKFGFKPKDVAADLENWFMRYKKLWKTVSKESECERLGQVFAWYADRLRDIK
ncbi:MAG: beta-N-acetylhexosaminidase [Lachnospiraceae bacterium]|nr:beta-N-acetylhexosaminidase [Lachnospiraceae bacterium]